VTTRPERWARMTGSAARVTLTGPKKVVSISSWLSSLKKPALKLACVVDQHVDPAQPVDRSRNGRLCVGGIGDVQLHRQEVVMISDRRADLLGVRPVATTA
jgi:hypothetical protein